MNKIILPIFLLFLNTAHADEFKVGGFIDSYYAYDSKHPANRERAFNTQAVRDQEFNINLAYIEGKYNSEKIRGRLAFQFGTAVQANYATEPISGRQIQEAYAGYQVTPFWWMDMGIMLSHIGVESWISRDNATYLRSLVADYSPYYQTGIRNEFKINDQWSAQVLLLNGWQNIAENNTDKALGTQIAYKPNDQWFFSYNTFFGNESNFRHFHDFVFKYSPSAKFSSSLEFDIGEQRLPGVTPTSSWNGLSWINAYSINKVFEIVARFERYDDRHGVLTPSLLTFGESFGVNIRPDPRLIYRFETRFLHGKVIENAVAVASVGLTL